MPAEWRHKQCVVHPFRGNRIHVNESEERQNTEYSLRSQHLHKHSTTVSFSMLVVISLQSAFALTKLLKGRSQYCWYSFSHSDAFIKPYLSVTITVLPLCIDKSNLCCYESRLFACHFQLLLKKKSLQLPLYTFKLPVWLLPYSAPRGTGFSWQK